MNDNALQERARRLGLMAVVERWDDVGSQAWVRELIGWEEELRQRHSLECRIRKARLEKFNPMPGFDWKWPKRINREQVDELFTLNFIEEAANCIFIGPNGVGKTMIAANLAYQALLKGHTVVSATASELLNQLVACTSAGGLERRLRALERPGVLFIDELGYLSYDNRHADLLFQVVSRRYEKKSIIITTNKPFAQWGEAFTNATTVVTLVDRLVHHAEIVNIEGDSYRLREAQERTEKKKHGRLKRSTATAAAASPTV